MAAYKAKLRRNSLEGIRCVQQELETLRDRVGELELSEETWEELDDSIMRIKYLWEYISFSIETLYGER